MGKRKMSSLAQAILLCNSLGPDDQKTIIDLLRAQQPAAPKSRKVATKKPGKDAKLTAEQELARDTGKTVEECYNALLAANGNKKAAMLVLTGEG